MLRAIGLKSGDVKGVPQARRDRYPLPVVRNTICQIINNTQEIGGMISAIKTGVDRAVESMGEASDKVKPESSAPTRRERP